MPTTNLTLNQWVQIYIGGSSTVDQMVQVTAGHALISLGTPSASTTAIDSSSFDDKVIYVPAATSVYARPNGNQPTTVSWGNFGAGQSAAGYELAAAANAALGVGFYVAGTPGVDARALILTQIAAAKAAGGGSVILPHIGDGGYTISDTITVDASNIHIYLYDNVTQSKTTKASAFVFTGASRTTRISNVGIHAVGGRWKIDANGRNVTNYPAYDTADPFYSAVIFRWCDDWRCDGLYGYNGLVSTLLAFQCGFGRFFDCWASDSIWECGISVNFDPVDNASWSDTDPATWSNAEIVSCRVFNVPSMYGITSYAATGTKIIDALVYNCGNDTPATYNYAGGGISCEGDVLTAGREALDRRVTVVRPRVYNCRNAALFITATGTKVRDADIYGTIAPTNRANPASEKGSGINVLGAATLDESGSRIRNSGTNGIILLANTVNSTPFYPSARIGGTVDTAAQHCIYARGVADLTIDPTASLKTATAGMGVKVDNSGGTPFNQAAGKVDISPRRIDASFDRAIDIGYVDVAHVAPRLVKNCRSGQVSTGATINTANTRRGTFGDITNEDANGKTGSIVQFASTCMIAGGSGTVSGDFATSNAPVNNLAQSILAPVTGIQKPSVQAYTANFTPNPRTMGNISFGALTAAVTVASPGGGPVAGDTFTMDFTQDATGGRTITWNAAFKGVTLAASGTAGQKAQITFRYDGASWAQMATSGWY